MMLMRGEREGGGCIFRQLLQIALAKNVQSVKGWRYSREEEVSILSVEASGALDVTADSFEGPDSYSPMVLSRASIDQGY